jgi:hypothetical protein
LEELEMPYDMRIQDLSPKAQEALAKALDWRPITLDLLRTITQRDIWIMPGYGRKTSDEIKAWAARHGVEIPERT